MNKAAAVACCCHKSQNKAAFPGTPARTPLPVRTLYPVTGHVSAEASELFTGSTGFTSGGSPPRQQQLNWPDWDYGHAELGGAKERRS